MIKKSKPEDKGVEDSTDMKGKRTTAQGMIDAGLAPETPREFVRKEVLARITKNREDGLDEEAMLQNLYPRTILNFETLESLTSALISGNNVLLFGPPGSGKTNLAKDVWNLFPKYIFVVEGCPVHDNPFSVVDPVYGREVPCCPFCRHRFGGAAAGGAEEAAEFDPASIDPSSIPVVTMKLQEGFGFARVQGFPEVFPDNLTGTLNLHKLEKIGDPTSPLVMEPGQPLQANRGILLVDEIGKLPKGTQNVLLQALQEGIVTPAKSRSTFPASFIAITTSNIDDLDNINEPLNDRLTNIFVGYNDSHRKNRWIIDMAVPRRDIFMPEIFLESAVYLVEAWRRNRGQMHELSEVGSNRAMIDIVTRAMAYSMMKGKKGVDQNDYDHGVRSALLGRIRARSGDSYIQNNLIIEEFIDKAFTESIEKGAKRYWCGFYRNNLKGDKPEGQRVVSEIMTVMKNRTLVEKGVNKKSGELKKFNRFSGYVLEKEGEGTELPEKETVVNTVLDLMEEVKTFEEKDLFEMGK